MHTSSFQSVAPKAIWNSESLFHYRFAWVAEDWVQKSLQTVLAECSPLDHLSVRSESLVLEVARFKAIPRLEDTIGRWTQRICSEQESIELAFNNLSGTPSLTLFARILDPAPLKKLTAQLRILDLYLTGNGQEPLHAVNRFSLTVAEGLQAEGFENLLYRIARVEFMEKFQINKLLLQKKERQHWKTIRHFNFSNHNG